MKCEKLHLLVVEDNSADVMLLGEVLSETKLDFALSVVSDGEEAMAFLRREGKYADAQSPTMVLLDINIPRKDGFEVLKEMKSDNDIKHIPVVMFTTSTREEDIKKAFTLGACSYITKMMNLMEFRHAFEQFGVYWTKVSHLPCTD